ncbi:MAG: FAD-dependent oxidoreductase [Pseudomonadales bacterium]|nr:FAD-dependent oxidoreductase [Pseudomonadales bacterium]
MMPTAFDYIVVGLGATGSASLYQLARRRAKVLGIDMFHPPHENGSSHGESRITRVSLGEGGHYVPLVRRSHEIWRELEAATGENLLFQCGGLIFGSTRSTNAAHGIEDFLQSTIDVARTHAVGHEILDAAELGRRFPQFKFDTDDLGYFEPEAGFLKPEGCLRAQLSEAQRMGATISTGTGESVPSTLRRVRLELTGVTTKPTASLVCSGTMGLRTGPQLSPYARAYRQVLYWFEQEGNAATFSPDNMPVYIRLA